MIKISTNKNLLNIEMIHNYLTNEAYWAKGRSIETVRKSIDNSLCFGAYENDGQIGFARIVTDYSIFAWVMDVFVIGEYKNKGIGKLLMDAVMNHPELQNLQRWGLATDDAHKFYEKYGFRSISRPEMFMEIANKPS